MAFWEYDRRNYDLMIFKHLQTPGACVRVM
jgi:hypothetical protein